MKVDLHPVELYDTKPEYEYYYKRGNRYYFHDQFGNRLSFDLSEPVSFKKRGKYRISVKPNFPASMVRPLEEPVVIHAEIKTPDKASLTGYTLSPL